MRILTFGPLLFGCLLFTVCGSLKAAEPDSPLKDKPTVLRTAWPQLLAQWGDLKAQTKGFTDDQKWELFRLSQDATFEFSDEVELVKPVELKKKFPTISGYGWQVVESYIAKVNGSGVNDELLQSWSNLVKAAGLEKETKGFSEPERRLFLVWMNDFKDAERVYPSIRAQKIKKARKWIEDQANKQFEEQTSSSWVERYMLIVASSKDYAKVKQAAERVAKVLGRRLDLRNLSPHPERGLTHPKADCEGDGAPGYPCYYTRADEHGETVSVEYSSAIQGLAPGYYVAVAASGGQDAELRALLEKARKEFPDAYLKRFKIWVGCMH